MRGFKHTTSVLHRKPTAPCVDVVQDACHDAGCYAWKTYLFSHLFLQISRDHRQKQRIMHCQQLTMAREGVLTSLDRVICDTLAFPQLHEPFADMTVSMRARNGDNRRCHNWALVRIIWSDHLETGNNL